MKEKNGHGTVGKTVTLRARQRNTQTDPWSGGERQARIVAEYPRFLVVEILPHKQPNGRRFSELYTTTIHKGDLTTGEITITE